MRNKLWSLVGLTASLLAGTAMAQPATSSSDDWMGDWLNNGQWYVGAKAGIGWLALGIEAGSCRHRHVMGHDRTAFGHAPCLAHLNPEIFIEFRDQGLRHG